MLTVSQIEQSVLTVSEISAKENMENKRGDSNKKEGVWQKIQKLISSERLIYETGE